MNNTPAPEALKEPGGEREAKRDGKPVPASLSEFLTADRASARAFIQLISKRPALTVDDLTQSQVIIESQLTKLGRVVELARSAAVAIPQPGILLRWCEQIVRSRDQALREWALDPGQDAAAAFRELLSWANPSARAKGERAKRQVAEACVMIGMNLLVARRALSPLDILRQLASVSGAHGDRRVGAALERAATKQLLRAGVKQLFDLGRVAALCEREIVTAEEARRAAIGLASDLRREKETIENERDALAGKVQGLSQALDERDSRINELAADLEGARVRALQNLDTLKARFRREIGDRLGGLLADAWDAIDTDPPHPAVARERLEIAREAIRREMEWLSKSLD